MHPTKNLGKLTLANLPENTVFGWLERSAFGHGWRIWNLIDYGMTRPANELRASKESTLKGTQPNCLSRV
jgi:hypothetical protein